MGVMMQGIPETLNNKPRRHVWEYCDAQGKPLGYVARFDDEEKKKLIPYFNRINGHGWQCGSITNGSVSVSCWSAANKH